MNYRMTKEVIDLLEKFEKENDKQYYTADINGFKEWVCDRTSSGNSQIDEPYWEGKEKGRSPESAITTLLLHLNRYAKNYSKSAISDSDFVTQEDFIYLINLRAFGQMTKMELIKKNIHDKPVGMLIITRLLKNGWIEQTESDIDRRNKLIKISEKGNEALEKQMTKIRQATDIVSGNLTYSEKMELIRMLNKLDRFHYPIFSKNIDSKDLIKTVYEEHSFKN
ncbi:MULTISPECIES: MarR family winged helix-turn-helix transcriptional regulator [Chryseobacterium]|jgi:DNA-binding MarR family transcriptional regulator|uniref:MarR family transcriptional regulator n=1 Tax=Chryseobacterium nepalense TaxID=1854498 RepID=A0ABY4K617_9FLAO|nr:MULTISPECIES: MarR family transcriptional regulator [Chryseobacterium]MEA1848673.1 MarR family transcriptional regulator [Chryseobacterium sp. MHB01]MEC5174809.1 DNA-binding MarR family transcriptional regulator [Chryseobacterium nepalense]UPQ76236.1 MarR family transcriptional regulator [Chryseobacterium nepalense]